MAETADLSPVRFAQLVAPAVTRAFVSGMLAGRASGGRELVSSYGGRDAVGYLIDLRNPLAAGRSVSPEGLAEAYRYHDSDTRQKIVQGSVDAGLLEQAPDGTITASERGQELLRELFAQHGRVLAEHWGAAADQPGAHHDTLVGRLNEQVSRVLAEAGKTAGGAWAVNAPPYEPDGTPPAVLLLNRLSTLRYHRSDAHAAAWRAAGLTAAEMLAMPWGSHWTPQRQAVEHDTNIRAAPPYAVLTPEERLAMLADFAALR